MSDKKDIIQVNNELLIAEQKNMWESISKLIFPEGTKIKFSSEEEIALFSKKEENLTKEGEARYTVLKDNTVYWSLAEKQLMEENFKNATEEERQKRIDEANDWDSDGEEEKEIMRRVAEAQALITPEGEERFRRELERREREEGWTREQEDKNWEYYKQYGEMP